MFNWLFPIYSSCIFCDREDISSLDTGICFECMKKAPFCNEADATFYYDDDMKWIIQNLKYNNKRYLAVILADLSREKIKNIVYDVVCFVPTRHKKERGYNQAELIARAIDNGRAKDVLEKIKDTPSQTYLSKAERIVNVKDCYRVKDAEMVRGKRVLLLDDVYTTGSTTNECKKELLKAGASSVSIYTICKTRYEC